MPVTGAYLGAWLQPLTTVPGHGTFAGEQQALPAVESALGRPLGLLHVYSGWSAPAPLSALDAVASRGSIPILDWGCPGATADVVTGLDDHLIRAEARALVAYGRPVFLRWCWEMNLLASHPALGGPADYVAAWRHIWTVFHEAGATNVSFVWCPALSGRDPAPYYPGADYVDWIGVDGYDHTGAGTFASVFGAYVGTWSQQGKPIMVAETGSPADNQVAYLQSVEEDLPSMPSVRAVVYFDAVGPLQDWRLTPAGLTAFAQLAGSPVFAQSG